MNIFLQFFTQAQSVDVIELVKVIQIMSDAEPISGCLKVHAQASIASVRFSDLDELVRKMVKKRFNRIELALNLEPTVIRGEEVLVLINKAIFDPSPTSALWLPTHEWRIDADGSSRNQYMTAKSSEKVLDAHNVVRQPSVLELLLEPKTDLSVEVVLVELADRLVNALPDRVRELDLFGCGDVIEPIFIPQFKRAVLMPQKVQVLMKVKPPAYSKLGAKFDTLHDVMFGSKRLCEKIGRAIGRDAKLVTAKSPMNFGAVVVKLGSDLARARERAGKWLIATQS